MDARVATKGGETEAHRNLKRLAVLWAQAQGYSACAVEVNLPRCRYRADVAAYRARGSEPGTTAIFECKQVRSDLRRDNCCTATARTRLEAVSRRRRVLEKHLRVHYPTLRASDSLFPEFDSYDFDSIEHHGYKRVVAELRTLQGQLRAGTKFECLTRYRCANLFYLVVPNELFCQSEVPLGWGALVASNEILALHCKPAWHEITADNQLRFLQRIAIAGTRHLNRQLEIDFALVQSERARVA
jgi:hypothetical protein